MKTKIFSATILLLALTLLSSVIRKTNSSQCQQPPAEFSIIDTLKAYCDSFPVNAEFAVAVVSKGKANYYGVRKESNKVVEISNKDAVFEIGSMTKVFTSVITATCVQNGQLRLDDPIQEYLHVPLRKINGAAPLITIQNLANHSSGFQRGPSNMNPQKQDDPYADYDTTLLYQYLRDSLVLDNPPGTRFAYSNLGVGILGFICAEILHKSYEAAVKEIVFQPLGMNSSFIQIPANMQNKLVQGLDQDGNNTSNWNLTNVFVGAGGIRSTAADIAKFLLANLDPNGKLGEALSITQQVTFSMDSVAGLGLGWFVFRRNGNTRLYHNGGTGGFRSCMIVDKTTQRAVVVLNNVSGFHPMNRKIDELCRKLVEIKE
ncbi:MAG: serine hydrolase domain-containing protein [Bacteroidota bacterium]